MEARDGYFIVV